mmetsp:Transcript_35475/g.73883  ORF Transcript_35475/g.73883 Transcript_35475/m.73883 type:complete len:250 (+) Transcript_35475:259-1008(+)
MANIRNIKVGVTSFFGVILQFVPPAFRFSAKGSRSMDLIQDYNTLVLHIHETIEEFPFEGFGVRQVGGINKDEPGGIHVLNELILGHVQEVEIVKVNLGSRTHHTCVPGFFGAITPRHLSFLDTDWQIKGFHTHSRGSQGQGRSSASRAHVNHVTAIAVTFRKVMQEAVMLLAGSIDHALGVGQLLRVLAQFHQPVLGMSLDFGIINHDRLGNAGTELFTRPSKIPGKVSRISKATVRHVLQQTLGIYG